MQRFICSENKNTNVILYKKNNSQLKNHHNEKLKINGNYVSGADNLLQFKNVWAG